MKHKLHKLLENEEQKVIWCYTENTEIYYELACRPLEIMLYIFTKAIRTRPLLPKPQLMIVSEITISAIKKTFYSKQ